MQQEITASLSADANMTTDDEQKRKEEENAAWDEHRSGGDKIEPMYWHRLRMHKSKTLTRTAAAAEKLLQDKKLTQKTVRSILEQHGVQRQLLINKLQEHIPKARIDVTDHSLSVFWISPTAPLLTQPDDPGQTQQELVVCHLKYDGIRTVSGFNFVVADHSSARFLQRTEGSGSQLNDALLAGAKNFLEADAATVVKHMHAGSTLFIPCPNGAFVSEIVLATADGEHKFVYARSRTFILESMRTQPLLPAASTDEKTFLVWLLHETGGTTTPSRRQSNFELTMQRVREAWVQQLALGNPTALDIAMDNLRRKQLGGA